MGLLGYILGWFKYIFNRKVSFLSLVHQNCKIELNAVVYPFARINGVALGDYSYIGNPITQ